jgi:hypothetical protein
MVLNHHESSGFSANECLQPAELSGEAEPWLKLELDSRRFDGDVKL